MKQITIDQIKAGNPEKLGVSVYAQGINFAVEAGGQEVSLLLYHIKEEKLQEIPFPQEGYVGDVASIFIEGLDRKKYEYAYLIGGEAILDPYAVLIRNNRCVFETEDYTYVENDMTGIPFEDMILYKIHVKGFSQAAGSPSKKKGTFRGVEEAIPYFQELGVNAIEIMPMYEWSDALKSGTLKNYWGYSAENYYFAPKAVYASTKNPAKECRQMIQALHDAGMECIMEFYFPKGTNPMLASEALIYWKLRYGVDGFHVIGEGAPVDLLLQTPVLKKTKLFLEKANVEYIANDKYDTRYIAEYNNGFLDCGRRFLKSDADQLGDFIYRIKRNPKSYGVVNYMANVNGFTLNDMVSYNEKHNEANGEDNHDGAAANDVWNCGMEGLVKRPDVQALRLKQMKNAVLYTMLAQGTPLLYQGDEFANSQDGNNNAYAMDNETGWVNWKLSSHGKKLREFVKEAIAFRKEHPILHMKHEELLNEKKAYGFPALSLHDERAWYPDVQSSSRNIGFMYCGKYALKEDGTSDDFIYVAYNAYWETKSFALPRVPDGVSWKLALQSELPEVMGLQTGDAITDARMLSVPPRSVMVLVGK